MASDISAQAWQAFLGYFEDKRSAFATPLDLGVHLEHRTVRTPALELIAGLLVEVAEGRCQRLIVSMSPQEGKSLLCSRRFPLWVLLRNPDCRIAIASYEHGIARRWGRAIRNDIQAHPELGLAVRGDTKAAHEWQLADHEGGVYCVGIGGALTGKPVDLMIIDDPVKGPKEADSPVYRDAAWDWWEAVASARLVHGAALNVQTRWHEDDLAGRLIRDEPGIWRVVNIPAQADHRPENGETDPLGREPGQFMLSARGRTDEQWEAIKTARGSRVWSALYQGRPSPGEGLIFHREWWKYYDTPQWIEDDDGARIALTFDEVVMSWDMTFKDTDASDFVVGQVWGRRGADAYLLDQVRGRMSFVETCVRVRAMASRWPDANAKLVEDKANGPAVISSLGRTVPGIIAVKPEGSKEARASAISPFVQAGNVHLPSFAPWVGEYIDEHASFPLSTHDDQVDATSQALARLLLNAIRPRVRFLG